MSVCIAIGLIAVLAVRAQSSTKHREAAKVPARSDYVGDAACQSCHQQITIGYSLTAHAVTSRIADAHSIAGSFHPGENVLETSNPSLKFTMTATKDGFFENAEDAITPAQTVSLTQSMDVVVGSGRKAQTYLYWQGDNLFELPVSYWVASKHWINSPGYPDGSIHFDRPVVPRCLECHGSWFQSLAPPENHYEKSSLVLGITCEKCHGPGREHIALYSSGAGVHPASKAILNPASFPRERQMDACAICHAGAATSLLPPLSFVPGQSLSRYLKVAESAPGASVDVHGNQVQLLRESRCFRESGMTCSTCHNVHVAQRDAAAFSKRCLSCHKPQQCGEYPKIGEKITQNCVDCHMPLQKSELLFSESNGETLKPLVRNHRIAVYPMATATGSNQP